MAGFFVLVCYIESMVALAATIEVLGMIYVAAILLAMRDYVWPPKPRDSEPFVVRKAWTLPIVMPLWLLAVVLWWLINGPVILCRSAGLAVRGLFRAR
jgi:hypothetical protein